MQGLKICVSCRSVKKTTSFRGKRKTCKSCESEANRARRQLHSKRVLSYCSSVGCIDCGETNPLLLEFDHEKGLGVKHNNVSSLVNGGHSWENIQEEMSKCVVRCVSCHRIKTIIEEEHYDYIESKDHLIADYLEFAKAKKAFFESVDRDLYNG